MAMTTNLKTEEEKIDIHLYCGVSCIMINIYITPIPQGSMKSSFIYSAFMYGGSKWKNYICLNEKIH